MANEAKTEALVSQYLQECGYHTPDIVIAEKQSDLYVDNLFPDEEYHRQKRLLEMELESLVVPQASAAEEAGKLLVDLPGLWAGANLEERRTLLLAMLDAVYVDAKEEKRIVGIKPKPPFRPIFQVATTKEGSGVLLMKEPPESTGGSCLWWRRGRVELPVQRKPPDGLYRLSWLFFLPPGWKPTPLLGGQPCFSLVPLTGVGDTAPQLSAPLPSP